jgi:[acyl-carrier-protein] S-malonyltransferase
MGRAFAEASSDARTVYDEASEAVGLDLARLSFEGPLDELTRTELQQPALVATELACLRALASAAPSPDVVIGHSVGEYAALAAAGVVTDREAVSLVRARGLATAAAAAERPGAMAAILGLDDAVVEELCSGIEGVWPANYNCPGQLVVSGETAAVDRLLELAAERGARRAVKLPITGAFHSPLVAAAAERLAPALDGVTWNEPSPPFMSTVTAELEPASRIRSVLLDQLAAPVRFTQAVRSLVDRGVDTFVEVGPGSVLSGLIRRIDRSVRTVSVGRPDDLAKLEEVLSAA